MDEYIQLKLWEDYEPQVDDYVIWNKGRDDNNEGWVYFKSEEYITIETGIKPKPPCQLAQSKHKYIHTLLLCPNPLWHQLQYVKTRKK
jgi:hypothetical protein